MARSALFTGALLLLLQFTIATEPQSCYAPDGTKIDSRFMPCISMDNTESMCCRLNDTDPDICQPNGLCYWDNEAGDGNKQGYYRSLCSKQDWDTPNCLPKTMCDADAGGRSDYTSQLNRCPDGSFCCGNTNDCCTEKKMFTVAPTLVQIGSSTDATGASTVTATTTSFSKAGRESSSMKLAVGLGVGIPLACLAVAAAGGGFWWGRRTLAARHELAANGHQGTRVRGEQVHLAASRLIHEADGVDFSRKTLPLELPTDRNESLSRH